MASNASHLSLFLPADLHKALERLACESDRSVSAEARIAIRQHLTSAEPNRRRTRTDKPGVTVAP